MFDKYLAWAMIDYEYFLFFLAAIICILHKIARRQMPLDEIVFRWFVLLPLGVAALYASMRHGMYSQATADKLGWLGGLFQFKVAAANLGFGLIAVLAFNASFGFRLAAVLGNACWMWGDAIVRVTKYYFVFSYAPAGFWLDVFLPLVLLMCLLSIKKHKHNGF